MCDQGNDRMMRMLSRPRLRYFCRSSPSPNVRHDGWSPALQLCLIGEPPEFDGPAAHFKRIHILRHGQALHNIQRNYQERDPPLTSLGFAEAAAVQLRFKPDLIIASPMTRAIQTAQTTFHSLLQPPAAVPFLIWPDLREAHDAICNKGVSRARLMDMYPNLDFSLCRTEWEYEPHSDESAFRRAEKVKDDLWRCDAKDIVIVSHRGFISYLIAEPSTSFRNCEMRSYILTQKTEKRISLGDA